MFLRRWLSIALVATIALAGCTGEAEETTEYCDSAAGLASLESLLSPESVRDPNQVRDAFESFANSLGELQDQAPDAISADIGELGSAVDDVIASMEAVNFDLTLLDEDAASNLLTPFTRPAVQRSLERVDAFDTLNCGQEAPATDPSPTAAPGNAPAATVEAPPTPDPLVALAAEYGDLIRTTFTDGEIEDMLAFAEVEGVNELVDAIIAEELTVEELDTFLQRTADGVPFRLGDDPDLDIMWNACATEDWAACDGLYTSSPLNSLYQRFADSCGQAVEEPTGGRCLAELDS